MNDERKWAMTIEEVAQGYGVDTSAIIKHLTRHVDELRNGIERGRTICHTLGGPQEKVVLYREGVIKLGMFIRSKKAVIFRQWATDLIVQHLDQNGVNQNNFFKEFSEFRAESREQFIENQKIFSKLADRIDDANINSSSQFGKLADRLDGVVDEVEELRETLSIFISDDDAKTIRMLIGRVKKAKSMDGRTIVGSVRKTLNVG